MKRDTLEILCCPACYIGLSVHEEGGNETIESGILSCPQCGRDYPVVNGIPRFIKAEELNGLNRQFTRFYDWFSYVYTLSIKVIFFLLTGGERKARMEILDRLEPTGGRLLEVSIGSGANLPYLFESPEGGEIYGLDISVGQLRQCRRYCHRQGWVVDLFLGMAEELPFKDNTFDSVLHIGGINFFSDRKKAIDEMIRVSKPGTKIVIADETERVARAYDYTPGFSRTHEGEKVAVTVPVDLVPPTMEDICVNGIWKSHGRYHGYSLEFRKPA